jgi:predicted Zn-dependent protease
MEKAGYDINAAVKFWEKMNAIATNSYLPGLLSTHPSSAERMNALRKYISQVSIKDSV